MKSLKFLLLVAMLCFSGCGMENNLLAEGTEKSEQETSTVVEKETNKTPDKKVNSDIRKWKSKVDTDWKSATVAINDTLVTFPCDSIDLFELTAGKLAAVESESTRRQGHSDYASMRNDDRDIMFSLCVNDPYVEEYYTDEAYAVGVAQYKSYIEESGCLPILFPNNLYIGKQVDPDDLIKLYGEPTDTDEEDDGSVWYEWVEYHKPVTFPNGGYLYDASDYFEVGILDNEVVYLNLCINSPLVDIDRRPVVGKTSEEIIDVLNSTEGHMTTDELEAIYDSWGVDTPSAGDNVVYVDGKELTLPCTYAEFVKLTGLKMSVEDEAVELRSEYMMENMHLNTPAGGYAHINLTILNPTDETRTLAKCTISDIDFNIGSVLTEGLPVFMLPERLYPGKPATLEDLCSKYGNIDASNVDRYSDGTRTKEVKWSELDYSVTLYAEGRDCTYVTRAVKVGGYDIYDARRVLEKYEGTN